MNNFLENAGWQEVLINTAYSNFINSYQSYNSIPAFNNEKDREKFVNEIVFGYDDRLGALYNPIEVAKISYIVTMSPTVYENTFN